MLCWPPARVKDELAEPATTVPVPSVTEFSMNATVPVGGIALAPVLTVAVKVIGFGNTGLDGLKVSPDVVTKTPPARNSPHPRPLFANRNLGPPGEEVFFKSKTATR